MATTTVSLAVVAGLLGGLVVGPRVADAVHRWIGWRVALPLLMGWVAPWPAARSQGDGVTRIARVVRPARVESPYRRWIAVVMGVGYAGITLRFGWSVALLPVLVLVTGLVAASAVDLVCWRIPTRFVYLTGAGALVAVIVAAVVAGEPGSLWGAAVGAGSYLVLLGGLHLISPRLLGFGDVRLGVLIGLVVGWMGWDATFPVSAPLSWTLFAMTIASLMGTVAGVVVLVVRRRARRLSGRLWREAYPFGPWLCVGGVIAILVAAPGPA